MRRKLIKLAVAAVSLVLAVFAAVLWVRGNAAVDSFSLRDGRHAIGLLSQPGMLRWSLDWGGDWERGWNHDSSRWEAHERMPAELARWGLHYGPTRPYVPPGALWGFSFGYDRQASLPGVAGAPVNHHWELGTPPWLFVVLGMIIPSTAARAALRRRRRSKAGLCPACGYDLRATPKGGRCPECGTACGTIASGKEEGIAFTTVFSHL